MSKTIHGNDNDEVILGSVGVDTLYGNGGEDTLYGFGGDDFLYGGDEDDDLLGGAGNDELHGNKGNDHLKGGFGYDYLYGDEGDDTLEGGQGNDFLSGGTGDDRLFGAEGNDTIFAGKGKDKVVAGAGDDKVYGENERDILQGNGGDDFIDGGEGDDVVIGGRGDDTLHGGSGHDSVRGGFDDDSLHGGEGDDTLEGGLGKDTLYGDQGNDRLFGGEDNDVLFGGAGDDKVLGGNGNDTVFGDDGRDILFGHNGEDILNGGLGNDVLWGGNGNDNLTGGDGDDSLWGQSGNDILNAGAGNDTLNGGYGQDILNGGEGNDTLFAGHVMTTNPTEKALQIKADGPPIEAESSLAWTTTTITINNTPFVVATQWGHDGVATVSRVETDGSLTETDRIVYDNSTGSVTSTSAGDLTEIAQEKGIGLSSLTQANMSEIDGQATLFLTSQNRGAISAWHISDEGELSLNGGLTFGHSQPQFNGGIVRENISFQNDEGEVYLYVTRTQQDRIDVLSYDPDTGAISETGITYPAGDGVSSIDIIRSGQDTFLVSAGINQINLYQVNDEDGTLTQTDVHPIAEGVSPSVNFYQASDGQVYIISSNRASESSSLFELSEHNTFTLSDTLTGGGAYMSSAGYINGEPVFVRPNAEAGVDLYTISENSHFVHQTTALGIDNDRTPPVIVQTLDGDYFLVNADGKRASVQLNVTEDVVAFDNQLNGGAGDDKLDGGNGNDLLIGGTDSDVLYGGEGHDHLIGDNNENAYITINQVASSPIANGNVLELSQVISHEMSGIGQNGGPVGHRFVVSEDVKSIMIKDNDSLLEDNNGTNIVLGGQSKDVSFQSLAHSFGEHEQGAYIHSRAYQDVTNQTTGETGRLYQVRIADENYNPVTDGMPGGTTYWAFTHDFEVSAGDNIELTGAFSVGGNVNYQELSTPKMETHSFELNQVISHDMTGISQNGGPVGHSFTITDYAKSITVNDNDSLLEDNNGSLVALGEQSKDVSFQSLGRSFGDHDQGAYIHSRAYQDVTNQTTGETGRLYQVRIADENYDPVTDGLPGGTTYWAFRNDFEVNPGDQITLTGAFSAGGNVDFQHLYRDVDNSNRAWTTTTMEINEQAFVVSTQFSVDGVTLISRVEDDGSLTETDRIVYDQSEGTVTSTSGGDITSILQDMGISVGAVGNGLSQSNMTEIDGKATLMLTSQNSGSITAWHISDDGKLSLNGGATFGHSQPSINGGIVRENVMFEGEDGTDYIFATRPQNDRIDVLTYDAATGKIEETGFSAPAGVFVSGIDVTNINGTHFVVASSYETLNLYRVDSSNGELSLTDSHSISDGSHHSNTVNFYQTPDGATYAISSHDASNSGEGRTPTEAFVYRVDAQGEMTLTDSVFGGGAYMATAGYMDGEPVFVMPNVSEGVDLYTLSNEGTLVHQSTVIDIENDWTPPVIVQTQDGSYYLVDADGNPSTAKLEFNYVSDDPNSGDDQLYGAEGNDLLEGNAGNDRLFGGSDNDTLLGGIGNDYLVGGEGADILTGGKGNDVFYFDLDSGTDVITDYTKGQDAIMIHPDLGEISQISSWQSGADTVLSFGDDDVIVVLEDFDSAQVSEDMFNFG